MKLEELDRALAKIEQIEVASNASLDYGILDDLLGTDELTFKLQSQVDRLYRKIAFYADVETPSVARTTVHWGGDVVTTWHPQLANVEQHLHALDEQLRFRSSFIRIVIVVTRKIAIISAAMSNPLASYAALKAGWELAGELQNLLGDL